MLDLDELRALGLTKRQVDQHVAVGLLHRRHQGVYAVGRPTLDFEGRCRAALLACGPDAAISHGSAAHLWDLRRSVGVIHVSAPRSRRAQAGLRVHRPRVFSRDDVVDRDGLRVTTVARTLLDLAALEPRERIERLLHEAQVRRVFDATSIYEACCRSPHHRGRRRLEAALHAEVAPTRSGLERALLALCRHGGLPRPAVNAHLWTSAGLEEVDLHWPDARLVVEVDGARYHSSRWRARRDAEKDARLRVAGWTVRRVPELELALAPSTLLADLHRLLRAPGCEKDA